MWASEQDLPAFGESQILGIAYFNNLYCRFLNPTSYQTEEIFFSNNCQNSSFGLSDIASFLSSSAKTSSTST